MFNLMKAEWYKWRHLRSTRVMAIVIVVFAFLTGAMMKISMDAMSSLNEESREQMRKTMESMPEGFRLGVYTSTDEDAPKTGDPIEIGQLTESQLNGGMFQLFVAIFTVLFVLADWQSGYIKNLAGAGTRRSALLFAKLMMLAVEVILFYVLYHVMGMLSARIFLGDVLYLESGVTLFRMLGVQLLLHLGFACLVCFLCVTVRNLAFGMTSGVLLASGIVTLVFQLANTIATVVFHVKDPDTGVISLSRAISEVQTTSVAEVWQRGLLIGCAYILVAVILSVIVMRRRDIA